MERDSFVTGFYDHMERRGATSWKFLQLELPKRWVHSATGSIYKV